MGRHVRRVMQGSEKLVVVFLRLRLTSRHLTAAGLTTTGQLTQYLRNNLFSDSSKSTPFARRLGTYWAPESQPSAPSLSLSVSLCLSSSLFLSLSLHHHILYAVTRESSEQRALSSDYKGLGTVSPDVSVLSVHSCSPCPTYNVDTHTISRLPSPHPIVPR
ncbi:hypothetical protein P3342_008619 [Pyrenophora teres f. teres]|nr:hypothetical protein P3342_008619 [Pyrenophora teres f. teres]